MSDGHLMIAGTGRSGTSFLVRYLSELGLDTEMSRSGTSSWNDAANAGFEDAPALLCPGQAPLVIKSPWLYEYVDELLAKDDIRLKAVIVPMRDLVEAAASRSIIELREMHQFAPWMASLKKSWETWGTTPGGTVYSLNPLDQARILAVGFHHLLNRLVQHDIPIVFLEFPRLVLDGKYLFDKLRPILPENLMDEAEILALHKRIANPDKVRITEELGRRESAREDRPGPDYPEPELLTAAAVRRELARVRGELDEIRSSLFWRLTRPIRSLLCASRQLIGRA